MTHRVYGLPLSFLSDPVKSGDHLRHRSRTDHDRMPRRPALTVLRQRIGREESQL